MVGEVSFRLELLRDFGGKARSKILSDIRRGKRKMSADRVDQAPDFLEFEKGIYFAFIKEGIRLAGDDGAPMPVQSNVDGAKFAAFTDTAVADSIRELEKREDDLSKAGVTMLQNVDGKSMVEQMSPEFLEFVLDTA